jgi:hypothetical protein
MATAGQQWCAAPMVLRWCAARSTDGWTLDLVEFASDPSEGRTRPSEPDLGPH